MQYIATLFGLASKETNMPNVLFFDARDGITKTQMRDMTFAKQNAHKARSVLGVGSKLNPVAGQHGNKYFPTFAKYASDKNWAPATYDIIMQENTIGFSIHVSDPETTDYQSYDATRAEYFPDYTIRKGTVIFNCPFDVKMHFPKCAAAATSGTSSQYGRFPSTLHLKTYNGSVTTTAPTNSDQFKTGFGFPSIAPTDVYTTTDVNFQYAMAMKACSVGTDGGNFADMHLPYRDDGLFWAPREAADETVNLAFGLFYWKALNTLVMLDDNDYDVPSELVPGTRPAFKFKATRLSI
ncbi:hypothetical protein HOT49_gp202 [Erwinia phage vB_EamM_Alexandra]|uniref:Uncharacterized protein n=1 Tax=Erwinia phage vB_EamM_Alexandra TaxID=2201424 RepID=A0A2Z4QDZ9_9CAUD|nr:hypothetical protein HOT49_gp202 [Erwinia phage vB_EamM_Alexandra]AWY08468.1 hypothetical protein Alexandra_204 [Erwinia phage vB_EamM_Alexandra]